MKMQPAAGPTVRVMKKRANTCLRVEYIYERRSKHAHT
jgi:hypothetical protein